LKYEERRAKYEKSDWDYAIKKLIKYKRPNAAITCLNAILYKQKNVDEALATKALLDAISSTEPINQINVHDTIEIIKALQDDQKTKQDDLFRIEWAYLSVLTGHRKNVSPKLLEQKLASEPDFFCEVIRLLYRSKDEIKSDKKTTKQQEAVAGNAWRLLEDWRILPGTQSDGSFSAENFNNWLKNVKTQCEESGHLDVVLSTIGKVLIHYIPDPNGLWIHEALAEVLNEEDSERMRNGFSMGIYNSRGAHFVDPTGKPEKELAAKYRQQAEEVEDAGYHRFAPKLRDLAKSYEEQAKQIIEEHKEEAAGSEEEA
jgi:hypothetical protein